MKGSMHRSGKNFGTIGESSVWAKKVPSPKPDVQSRVVERPKQLNGEPWTAGRRIKLVSLLDLKWSVCEITRPQRNGRYRRPVLNELSSTFDHYRPNSIKRPFTAHDIPLDRPLWT